jgi:ATP-dependent protease HslVU (ClpYQ) peptidase subunit
MTTIAIKEDVDGWSFAWDRQVTAGNRKEFYTLDKVFRNRWTFGVAGSVRAANVLNTMSIPARKAALSTFQYVVTVLVPAISDKLADENALEVDNGEANASFSVLVEVDGDAFFIGGDFAVLPIIDYGAVGSGGDFALGALESGASLKKAVKIAAKLDLYSGYEITVMRSENV